MLKNLISQLLKIPLKSIRKFTITNPEIPPENLGDKFCRLDITMNVDGQRVNLEIQVRNEGDYPERALFHWAREYSTSLAEGEEYAELPCTIIISIVSFRLFNCEEFHSEYQALEVTRHTSMTDKMCLHFFELPKVPEVVSEENGLLLWLTLFKAETEEELTKIEVLEVPEMKEAIGAYRSITATPEFQEMERLRSKARHDEAQALYQARNEKALEVARKLLRRGLSIADIAEDTGLSRKEVEHLHERSQ